jgi:predicted outer membrane repeat protein
LLLQVVLNFPSSTPGIDLPPEYIPGPTFFVEFVSHYPYESGINYGVLMNAYPVMDSPATPCVFKGNFAGTYGGAIRLIADVVAPVMINAEFSGNRAGMSGGALFFRSTIVGASMTGLNVNNNFAQLDGGGIILLSVNEGFAVRSSVMTGNVALQRGGGISIHLNNGNQDGLYSGGFQIKLQNCILSENSAGTAGGAIHIGESNIVEVHNCSLFGNIAHGGGGGGGGLFVDTRNYLLLSQCTFANNLAHENGRGISSRSENTIDFTSNLTMFDNQAHILGGAISLMDGSDCFFHGFSTFEGNSAVEAGGAIACQASLIWNTASNATFAIHRNSARRGSAILFAYCPHSSSRSLRNILFSQNNASIGGTVFWVHDSIMTNEPLGLSSSSVMWVDNIAGYGIEVATQPIRILGLKNYTVTVYVKALEPPLIYELKDYYNQSIENDDDDSFQISIIESYCENERVFLSGTDTQAAGVQIVHGSATFNDLEAYCHPLGNIATSITATMKVFEGQEYSVITQTNFLFRDCILGEELIDGSCVECPSGTYSVSHGSACMECVSHDGIKSCEGNDITLKKGYWRRYAARSSEVLESVPRA